MQLVTYSVAGQPRTGALRDGWIVDLAKAWERHPGRIPELEFPTDLSGLLQADSGLWSELNDQVAEILARLPQDEPDLVAAGVVIRQAEAHFLPPVQTPGKILCVGLNYPVPGTFSSRPDYPVIFGKFANTLVGHRQPILLPRISRQIACEGELALVIGRGGRHIARENALDHLAGCTLANDLTASDLESRSSQWMTGKLPDTFTPLGPALVTLDELPPLDELVLQTYHNGKLVLSGATGNMLFDARELISYLSDITTLTPGDLILTGSPKSIGNLPAPKVLVEPGDEIMVVIDALGSLVNQAIAEEPYDG